MLRLQQHLAFAKDVHVEFQCKETVRDAIQYFLTATKGDRLIVLDASMGIQHDWLFKRHPMDEVVAAYPKRELDWAAVAKAREEGTTDPESLRKAAYVYNFTPASSECEHQSYVRASVAQAKILSVSRAGAARVLERLCPWTLELKDTMVDVSTKATNAGPYDFVGCVGHRLLQQ